MYRNELEELCRVNFPRQDIAIDLPFESGLDSDHIQAPIAWQGSGSGSLAQLDPPDHAPLTHLMC